MAKIAVMGYGTIGSGVVEAFSINREEIKNKIKEEICVKYVLDLRDFPGDPAEKLIVHDYKVIAGDPEISVVVETMGGTEPAFTFCMEMLKAGKSVVTSNKALVADYGTTLMETAVANKCNFFFEASVGGGIPVIRPMYDCLSADIITEIAGILNGTTNYILTKMCVDGSDFKDVLKEAQKLGYAEHDPTADIEAIDTCRKIAILSSIAMGKRVIYKDIHTEGITEITTEDFKYAKKMDMAIKLVAISRITEDDKNLNSIVAPFLVDSKHPLYGVEDVFNAVMIKGNIVDTLMFYGRGAGKLPTAAAVAADVIKAVKLKDKCETIPWSEEIVKPGDYMAYKTRFMVRISSDVSEKQYTELFKTEKVIKDVVDGEIALITSTITEKEYLEAEKECGKVISRIRIYH